MNVAATAASISENSTAIWYIISSFLLILGAFGGAVRYYGKQKERWTMEGQQRAEQTQMVKDNSDKLAENSTAMAALTRELHDFMVSIRTELTVHEGRISRLERWREIHGTGAGENKRSQ